jgi:hypothetical protein
MHLRAWIEHLSPKWSHSAIKQSENGQLDLHTSWQYSSSSSASSRAVPTEHPSCGMGNERSRDCKRADLDGREARLHGLLPP